MTIRFLDDLSSRLFWKMHGGGPWVDWLGSNAVHPVANAFVKTKLAKSFMPVFYKSFRNLPQPTSIPDVNSSETWMHNSLYPKASRKEKAAYAYAVAQIAEVRAGDSVPYFFNEDGRETLTDAELGILFERTHHGIHLKRNSLFFEKMWREDIKSAVKLLENPKVTRAFQIVLSNLIYNNSQFSYWLFTYKGGTLLEDVATARAKKTREPIAMQVQGLFIEAFGHASINKVMSVTEIVNNLSPETLTSSLLSAVLSYNFDEEWEQEAKKALANHVRRIYQIDLEQELPDAWVFHAIV